MKRMMNDDDDDDDDDSIDGLQISKRKILI